MQGHAHAIKSPPVTQPHHSSKRSRMACTYLLTVDYNECLGRKANPLSFTSLRLVDLCNRHSQYLSTIGQLIDALPKSMDPASRFAVQGHIACPGQTRLRHSMRAAIWFLLPSDGTFRRSSSSLQYFLTRQGRCVVLRVGDVTLPQLGTRDRPSSLKRSRQGESPSPRRTPQAPQEDEAPQKTGKASSSASNHNWKPAWNQPVAHPRDEYPSEASPDLPAPTASPLSDQL